VSLDLAEVAKFAILVGIAAWSGLRQILCMSSPIAGFGSGSLVSSSAFEWSNFIVFILGVLVVRGRHWLLSFSFSLLSSHNVIHVVHNDGGVVSLSHYMSQFAQKCSPEKLHFEKMHHAVNSVLIPLVGSGGEVPIVVVRNWSHGFVSVAGIAVFDDQNRVSGPVEEIPGVLMWLCF
jgi:hypothetical protein